jgi:outer membrane protein TolC
LLQVAEERDRQISERVQKGDLPQFDRVDNERAVLQRQAQLLAAERAVRNTEYNLALFFRGPDGEPQNVAGRRALDRIPLPLFVPVHATLFRRPPRRGPSSRILRRNTNRID